MAKQKGEPKLTSCSPNDVFHALKKLGGFDFFEGSRHTKVKHVASGKSSTIPRHSVLNRHLVKGFVDDYLVRDVGIEKENVFKYLWC